MSRHLWVVLFVATAFIVMPTSPAMARFVITLDDLGTAGVDVTVIDNTDDQTGASHADLNAGDGIVRFAGLVGNFVLSFTTGTSAPVTDGASIALTSLNVTGAGQLEIKITDTDFTPPSGLRTYRLRSGLAGFPVSGTMDYESYYDPNNAEFGTTVSSGVSSAGPGFFAVTNSLPGLQPTNNDPFSLTARYKLLTLGGLSIFGGLTEFTTPEPGSLAVWSTLAGIGFIGMRRRHRTRR